MARYGTVAAALVIFAGFALASDRFLSVNNISNILIQISVLMIVSSGLTVAVASGEFDLSVGQVASLSGVLVAGLMIWAGLPVAAAMALAILAGVIIGLVNGLLVTRLRIPSLIATLAMGPIALGLNYAYTNGDSIYASMPRSFYYIATGRVGIVPVPVIIALVIEVGPDGITANCVCPGIIVTEMGRTDLADQANVDKWTAITALRRLGQPEGRRGTCRFSSVRRFSLRNRAIAQRLRGNSPKLMATP